MSENIQLVDAVMNTHDRVRQATYSGGERHTLIMHTYMQTPQGIIPKVAMVASQLRK